MTPYLLTRIGKISSLLVNTWNCKRLLWNSRNVTSSARAFSGGKEDRFFEIQFILIGGRLITDLRNRLGANTIKTCMCMKSWLKY